MLCMRAFFVGAGNSISSRARERGWGGHYRYILAGRDMILVGLDFFRKERNLSGLKTLPGESPLRGE